MASIQINSNNTYRIRVYIGEDINGKQLFKSFTYTPKAKTPAAAKKEVEKYAAQLEDNIRNGQYLSGEEITFNDFYQLWVKDYAPKYLSQSKLEQNCNILKAEFLPVIGNKKLSQINAVLLQTIVTEMETRLKPAAVKSYFTCLSSVMNRAYRANIIAENPVRRVILPKIVIDPTDIHYFDVPHTKAFLRALDNGIMVHHPAKIIQKKNRKPYTLPAWDEHINVSSQFKALFTLAIFSGMRRGELLALTWNDIDFDGCIVTVTKATASTKKYGQIIKDPKTKAGNRVIALPVNVFDALQAWKNDQMQLCRSHGTQWQGEPLKSFDNNFVFIQDNGRQMHLSTPLHKFRELVDYYNMGAETEEDKLPVIKFHDLRHTSASLLIASGMVDIETVARRMGHSNVSMTLNRYGHALPSQDTKAVQALGSMLNMNDDPEEVTPAHIQPAAGARAYQA